MAELEEHETGKLIKRGLDPTTSAQRASRLVSTMDQAFPDARVAGWEPLEGKFGLPDPDDEHVLAAAVVGGAGALVTENLKDFPRRLVSDRIDLVRAADFARDQVGQSPYAARRAVEAMATRNKHSPNTVEEILEVITTRYGMHEAADLIRDVRD